jgi:hypothetical protein
MGWVPGAGGGGPRTPRSDCGLEYIHSCIRDQNHTSGAHTGSTHAIAVGPSRKGGRLGGGLTKHQEFRANA